MLNISLISQEMIKRELEYREGVGKFSKFNKRGKMIIRYSSLLT